MSDTENPVTRAPSVYLKDNGYEALYFYCESGGFEPPFRLPYRLGTLGPADPL
jgi:hypothetical protein